MAVQDGCSVRYGYCGCCFGLVPGFDLVGDARVVARES